MCGYDSGTMTFLIFSLFALASTPAGGSFSIVTGLARGGPARQEGAATIGDRLLQDPAVKGASIGCSETRRS
jgi:hypothetical protein